MLGRFAPASDSPQALRDAPSQHGQHLIVEPRVALEPTSVVGGRIRQHDHERHSVLPALHSSRQCGRVRQVIR